MSELGLELEERDGGIFVTGVQEHGCVAAHGMFIHVSHVSPITFKLDNVLSSHWLKFIASFLC